MSDPPRWLRVWQGVVRRIVPRLDNSEVNQGLRSRDHARCATTLHAKLAIRARGGEQILTSGVRRADLERCPIRKELTWGQIVPRRILAAMSIDVGCRRLESRFFGSLTHLYYSSTAAAFFSLLLRLGNHMQKRMCWNKNSGTWKCILQRNDHEGHIWTTTCKFRHYCAMCTWLLDQRSDGERML